VHHVVRCRPVDAPERASSVNDDAQDSTIDSISLYDVPEGPGIAASPPLPAIQANDVAQPVQAEKRSSGLWADVVPLLKFAVPTLCIAVTSPLMSLADTSVVGLYSEAQLAAMSPATSVVDGLYYMMTFIPMAVTNLVSLHMARKNHSAAGVLLLATAVPVHSSIVNLLIPRGTTAVSCASALHTYYSTNKVSCLCIQYLTC
jgi:hypothetical protein